MMNLKLLLPVAIVATTSALYAADGQKSVGTFTIPSKGTVLKQNVNKPSPVDLKADSGKKAIGNASISYIGGGSSGEESSGASGSNAESQLKSAGLQYTKLENGNFRVDWTIKDGPRTHVTFVNGRASNYNGIEMRNVWAIGFASATIDSNNLQALLEMNANYKVGAWELQKANGKMYAVFTIKIPADASGAVLKAASIGVAEVADEIEQKATRKDEF